PDHSRTGAWDGCVLEGSGLPAVSSLRKGAGARGWGEGRAGQGPRVGSASVLSPPCSVTLLLFNTSRRSLVLVKQFRPAVYASAVERLFPESLAVGAQEGPRELRAALPGAAGVTVELCAGLVDRPGLSLEETACKEAWEECGYRLEPSALRRVATYRAGVGLTGSSQTMFYAEVTEDQHSGPGGGVAEEGELIEVVHLPLDGAQAFASDPDIPKTLGVLFAISWFFGQIAPRLELQRDTEALPDHSPSTLQDQ
ncbi:uridine diphosphate glucose pyrophosphatase NUDT14, partial [Perognathus longimembris pacificus]|uniref:uridine diphosphate glucose pyrophosphatase NUDT14 n=1 Tax=Perognathus longimembris pacificus TaxID=214514 RepID=UPI0020190FA1